MKPQKIGILQQHAEITQAPSPDTFAYNKSLGWVWLQKLCFWILGKIGCHEILSKVEVTKITVNPDSFIEKLATAHQIIDDLEGEEPDLILIGSKDYSDLMGEKDLNAFFSFTGSYEAPYGRLLGMTVCVIPWMHGVLPVTRRCLAHLAPKQVDRLTQ